MSFVGSGLVGLPAECIWHCQADSTCILRQDGCKLLTRGFSHPSAACQGNHGDTMILLQACSPARHLAYPPLQPRAVHEEAAPPGLSGTPARGHAPQQQLSGQGQEPPVHSPQCWQGCAVCSCSSSRRGTVSLGCDCSPAAPSRSARFLCYCLKIGKLHLSTGKCWDAATVWSTNTSLQMHINSVCQ